LETVIDTAIGQIDDDVLNGPVGILRVHAIGGTEHFGHFEFFRVDIDHDNARRPRQHGALNHAETDPAETEYRYRRTRRDLGGVQHRADARGDAAAEQAHLVERRSLVDFGDRDFR